MGETTARGSTVGEDRAPGACPPPGPRRDGLAWLSVHLHLAASGDGAASSRTGLYADRADRVLLDFVAPAVRRARRRGDLERFFFIRYSVGGPHLRVRLLGEAEQLRERCWPELAAVAGSGPVSAVERVTYEPETERYGGTAAALEVAEDLFDASTRAVLALLAGLPAAQRPARLGKGLLALLAGLSAFVADRREAARLARSYGTAYLRQTVPGDGAAEEWAGRFAAGYRRQAAVLEPVADAAWEALVAPPGDPEARALPAALAAYRADLVRVRRRLRDLFEAGHLRVGPRPGAPLHRATHWARDVRTWLLSQLHMTSNRLGVTIAEETYLALAAAAALDPEAERRTA